MDHLLEFLWRIYVGTIRETSAAAWIPTLLLAAIPAMLTIGCFLADNMLATVIFGTLAVAPFIAKSILILWR
jgi:hypothetical protein